MQANMFTIKVVDDKFGTTSYMVKRIVPKELPDKASEVEKFIYQDDNIHKSEAWQFKMT